MNKLFLLFSVVCLSAGTVVADIAIDNNNKTSAGKYYKAVSVEVDQAFVQLIWAEDLSGQAGIDASLDIGEYLLTSFTTFPGIGGLWDDQFDSFAGLLTYESADIGVPDINDGYFFYRVFENGALAEGDFYLQQYVQGPTLDEYDAGGVGEPPSLPSGIYDPEGSLGGTLSAAGGAQQIIPEPAVASLLILFGGGIMVSRRIFSKG